VLAPPAPIPTCSPASPPAPVGASGSQTDARASAGDPSPHPAHGRAARTGRPVRGAHLPVIPGLLLMLLGLHLAGPLLGPPLADWLDVPTKGLALLTSVQVGVAGFVRICATPRGDR
jgi:hypothetical protein